MACSKATLTNTGSFVTTLNKDYARVLGIRGGTKLVQEMRGNAIIIKRL